MVDAEMKDAKEDVSNGDVKVLDADAKRSESEKKTPLQMMHANLKLLSKAVATKENRTINRVLRQSFAMRKQFTYDMAEKLLNVVLSDVESRDELLGLLHKIGKPEDEKMQVESGRSEKSEPENLPKQLPEAEALVFLIVLVMLIDHKLFEEAKACACKAVEFLDKYNRRTLDLISARIFFYFSWSYERTGCLSQVRARLLAAHTRATLRHDEVGQETLLNLLLRNLLHYNLYDQAEKLRSQAQQPESHSNSQYCRYLYYLGRIRAVQLDYAEAKEFLTQAIRKAPRKARGFQVEVQKWLVIVQLLLGEIPERALFQQPVYKNTMVPYFELAASVRIGDLAGFKRVSETYHNDFRKDKTHHMVVRLRRNVIRTGLRRISLAYSRISLVDIATKLGLQSAEDAEYIVAKAIRDGGIDATLDNESMCMQSKEVVDIYSTSAPISAFHSRISFCLDTHNEAVKAMRYDGNAQRTDIESAEARRERLEQEKELAKHIAEEDEDDF